MCVDAGWISITSGRACAPGIEGRPDLRIESNPRRLELTLRESPEFGAQDDTVELSERPDNIRYVGGGPTEVFAHDAS